MALFGVVNTIVFDVITVVSTIVYYYEVLNIIVARSDEKAANT